MEKKKKFDIEGIVNEIAMALISSLSGPSVYTQNTKKNFASVRSNIQRIFYERYVGLYIDLSQITLDSRIGKSTLWEWAKRMDKINGKDLRDAFFERYQQSFRETYLDTLFRDNPMVTEEKSVQSNFEKQLQTATESDVKEMVRDYSKIPHPIIFGDPLLVINGEYPFPLDLLDMDVESAIKWMKHKYYFFKEHQISCTEINGTDYISVYAASLYVDQKDANGELIIRDMKQLGYKICRKRTETIQVKGFPFTRYYFVKMHPLAIEADKIKRLKRKLYIEQLEKLFENSK